jgi:hypothetical protein
MSCGPKNAAQTWTRTAGVYGTPSTISLVQDKQANKLIAGYGIKGGRIIQRDFPPVLTGATGHGGSRGTGVPSAASIKGRSGSAVRGHPHQQEEEARGKGSGEVKGRGLDDRRRRWEETFGGAHSAKERAPEAIREVTR